MAKASTTITFADGDQITSAKLNQIIGGFSLGSDSVDGQTITLSGSGVLSLGTVVEANYGALSIPTAAYKAESVTAAKLATDAVETAKIKDAAVTNAKLMDGTILFVKLGSAALATQAEMQSETASKLAAAALLKYHPGVAKAYGTVSIESGVTTITGGYNVTSASDTGTGRRITLAVTMANTNYQVLASYKDSGSVANSVGWAAVSTTQFDLHAGAEAAGRAITFEVKGQLA